MALDEASFRAAAGRRYRTRIGDIFEALDEADTAVLTRVLADRGLSHDVVAATLTKAGYPVSATAVRYHRMKVLTWRG